jgi:putative hydrolase of the HAD superfamily
MGIPIYRAVLFDLDGTLYDRDALVREIAEAQHDAHTTSLPPMPRDEYVRRIIDMDDHGIADKAQGYGTLALGWGLPEELGATLLDHFWTEYDRRCRTPTDTTETLTTLRDAGVKLGVITNGKAARQSRKLELMGLIDAFDTVLISETEGVRKPDREIFERALARLGAKPENALFVGDSPDADVMGALGAGLSAIWKYVPYWQAPAHPVPVVHRLTETLPHCFR